MRLLIVDDEPLARANLALLCELKDGVAVVGEADSGRAAITAAEQLHPDVILLDTQLPDMTGLEVLRAARRTAAPLGIMVTTYPEQAAPPLETGVIDCLVKPIHIARFTESLERARRCYRSNGAPAEQTHRRAGSGPHSCRRQRSRQPQRPRRGRCCWSANVSIACTCSGPNRCSSSNRTATT